MTKTEAAMEWLRTEYGITSESELDRELARTKLDIGIFVSPLPKEAKGGATLNEQRVRTA